MGILGSDERFFASFRRSRHEGAKRRWRWSIPVLVAISTIGALTTATAVEAAPKGPPSITVEWTCLDVSTVYVESTKNISRINVVWGGATSTIKGIESSTYSIAVSDYPGLSQVTVVFEEGTDIYFARQQVSERLSEAKSALPPSLEPTLGPTATGLGEIFMFTVDAEPGAKNSDGTAVTPTDLRSVHDWIIRPQLLRVPGVVEVNPIGGYKKQIVVAPDPGKLA